MIICYSMFKISEEYEDNHSLLALENYLRNHNITEFN